MPCYIRPQEHQLQMWCVLNFKIHIVHVWSILCQYYTHHYFSQIAIEVYVHWRTEGLKRALRVTSLVVQYLTRQMGVSPLHGTKVPSLTGPIFLVASGFEKESTRSCVLLDIKLSHFIVMQQLLCKHSGSHSPSNLRECCFSDLALPNWVL